MQHRVFTHNCLICIHSMSTDQGDVTLMIQLVYEANYTQITELGEVSCQEEAKIYSVDNKVDIFISEL